jgi:Ca2+-binding EF-hand superfamily protein
MTMKAFGVLTAAVALTSGCAVVDTAEDVFRNSPLAGTFTQLDQDGDGVVSPQEAQTAPVLAENFDRLDSNRSGGIDAGEYEAAATQVAEVNFRAVDLNGDGVISEREAGTMPLSLRETFDSVDADGDGNVSQVEYQAARVNLLQALDFAEIDTDGDGVITRAETAEVPILGDQYDRFDVNSDGMLSPNEFQIAQR